jgi:preprotein translocase subunit SecE
MSSESEKPDISSDKADEAQENTELSQAAPVDAVVDGGDSEVVGLEPNGLVEEDPEALMLGVQKYVHAAFFVIGIIAAYLLGKLVDAAWSLLADVPAAVRAVPQLIQVTEEQRGFQALLIGTALGVVLVLRYYRRPAVKEWSTAVATELARVTWPDKDTVTNGTIVVMVAGLIATLYVTVLDRFWGYLTNMIYGV